MTAINASNTNLTLLCSGNLALSHWSSRILLSIFIILFIILSTIGNGAIILALRHDNQDYKLASNHFLVSLSMTDFLFGLFCMPLVLISCLAGGWIFNHELCEVIAFISSFFCISSVITLAALSIEKYRIITSPLTHNRRTNKWRIHCIIGFIWLYSATVAMLPLLGWGKYVFVRFEIICTVAWWKYPGYAVFLTTNNFALPSIIMAYTYYQMLKIARQHHRRVTCPSMSQISDYQCESHHQDGEILQDNPHRRPKLSITQIHRTRSRLQSIRHVITHRKKHYRQHIKAAVTILAFIGSFILCWLPYFISMFYLSFQQTTILSCTYHQIATWLTMANPAINPIIYATMDQSIRKNLKAIAKPLKWHR